MKLRVGTWLLFLMVLAAVAGCIDVTPAMVGPAPTSASAPGGATETSAPLALAPTESPTRVPDTPTVAPTPTRTPFRRQTPTVPPTETPVSTSTPVVTATPPGPVVRVVTPGAAPTQGSNTPVVPAQATPVTAIATPTPTRPAPPPPTPAVAQPVPTSTPPGAGTPKPTVQAAATIATTPVATATPTRVPATPTPTPPFPAAAKTVNWLPNCGLTQVRLQLRDPLGFRKNGFRFKIESADGNWSAISFPTGFGSYEPGETDFSLNNRPIANTWNIWLLNRQGAPVEPRLTIATDTNDCRPGGIGHQVAVVDWLWYREP